MKKSIDYNVIVDIPEGAHVCSDNRVYVVLEKRYYQKLGYNMDNRLWLGKAISDKKMHPNNDYKERYRDKLAGIGHLNLPQYVLKSGLYGCCLSLAKEYQLYDDLIKCFGPANANLIMDYSMYSIAEKTNVAKDFQSAMTDRKLFLGRAYSDSWIQEKFSNEITENQIMAFKIQWLKRCREAGTESVWICIDGSNNDCDAQIDEAEKGNAKSHLNTNIVSFMYAVDQNGKPILSNIYRGSRVDCTALSEIIDLLKQCEVKIKGIILDRGFCNINNIELAEEAGYDYVIMMKESTYGFQQMMSAHRDDLRMTWKTALGNGFYGITDTVQLFKTNDKKSCVALVWDSRNGVERSNYLVDEILTFIENATEKIKEGTIPAIPSKYKQYLSFEPSGDSFDVVVHEDNLQNAIFEKGYYALISSKTLSAKTINDIYDLRDASEKQYAILKTQLGYYSFRSHNMHGIKVRENIAFVASIIRNSLMTKLKQLKPRIDLNKGIKELDLISINLGADGKYHAMRNCSDRQNTILGDIGLSQDNLDYFADHENKRIDKQMVNPEQSLMDENPKEENDTQTTRRITEKPNPNSKGSSAKMRVQNEPRRRGRPPKQVQQEQKSESPKRGRGRPKGSKNKPKNRTLIKVGKTRS